MLSAKTRKRGERGSEVIAMSSEALTASEDVVAGRELKSSNKGRIVEGRT
jgi:hypothetical protein